MADAQREKLTSPSPLPDPPTSGVTQQQHSVSPSSRTTYAPFSSSPSSILPSPGSSDNLHGTIHQHSAPHTYYGGGYSPSAYTLSTPPGPNISHNPSFTGYTPFRDPRVGEGGVASPSPHVSFQPMLQPHVPMYYQPHPSTPINSHFIPVHYPPASPSHFSYPSRSFPGSPIFQPYTTHNPYASPDIDTQGAWYYLPHTTQQHADSNVAYQSHYSRYPSSTPLELENPNWAPLEHSASRPPNPQEPVHPPRPRSTLPPVPGKSQTSPSVLEQAERGATGLTHDRGRERPLVRKPYHPNSPPHRSEWVMWVGNIPSDATHDELWKFFNQSPSPSFSPDPPVSARQSPPSVDHQGSGVISIFLISKSSCVFVNYETEEHLNRSIERFNGRPLRPLNPRCLRLVCRIRRKEDDLKAGVGGQRGQGLHSKWIKEQKFKERQAQSAMSASPHSQAPASDRLDRVDQLTAHTAEMTLSSDDEGKREVRGRHRSSSGSFASTDSSLLSSFFPKRYFILKSLTQYDLDLSIQHNLWATQKHNEGILDQAYRTSQDVFLFFSVNKSGEFYGYARMAGPVQHGVKNVLWASRAKDASTAARHLAHDPASRSTSVLQESLNTASTASFPDPEDDGNRADAITPGPRRDLNSAPPELGKVHRQISLQKSPTKSMTLPPTQEVPFELDPQAPIRAIRSTAAHEGNLAADVAILRVDEGYNQEDDTAGDTESQSGALDSWGDCFKVEWLCTERLPFYWTRNLRNPWNHDREVKISRDGTELEPGVGEMLLNAWEVMKAEGGEIPPASSGSGGATLRKSGQGRRPPGGAKSFVENQSKPSGPR